MDYGTPVLARKWLKTRDSGRPLFDLESSMTLLCTISVMAKTGRGCPENIRHDRKLNNEKVRRGSNINDRKKTNTKLNRCAGSSCGFSNKTIPSVYSPREEKAGKEEQGGGGGGGGRAGGRAEGAGRGGAAEAAATVAAAAERRRKGEGSRKQ